MITRQNLIDARALIADRRHWLKGKRKEEIAPGEYGYCAVGAISAVIKRRVSRNTADVRRIFGDVGIADIVEFNDNKGHECTVAAFDAAIEKMGE